MASASGSTSDPAAADERVVIGQVVGILGVRGWVKIHAYTRHREDIADYDVWQLGRDEVWREFHAEEVRTQGGGLAAKLAGVETREAAATLVGHDIAVPTAALPPLAAGEYYWAQLKGLAVENLAGVSFGQVSHLFDTGANDVMVVKGERERLIPYIRDVIVAVDLDARRIRVDWDADF